MNFKYPVLFFPSGVVFCRWISLLGLLSLPFLSVSGDSNDTGFGDSNEFSLDTTDTGSGGYMGFGDSNEFSLDTTDTGTGGYMGFGDSNEFTLDTTDTGSGGYMGFGDSNEFTLDTTDTGSGGYMGFGDSNEFTLDTTDTGSGGYMGFGDSNEFTLNTTDTGTAGYMGFGDSNDFVLDTTDTGTGGHVGTGDSNEFALDTTDGNGTDSNASGETMVTVTGTVYYDGIVPGAAYVWALEANGSNVAEHILPAGEGNFTLSVAQGRAYDFKAFVDGTGNGHPNNGEVWKHFEDWNNTLGRFNLTQVDGNLTGINFYLSDKDADFDGFLDWQEYQAGTGINDANSTPGLDFGLVAWYPFDGNASDMSGNGNHGTVHGANLGIDRHGHQGMAYELDGVDNYIEVTDNSNFYFGSRGFSVTAWTKKFSQVNSDVGMVVSQWNTGSSLGSNEWFLSTSTSSQIGRPSFGLEISNQNMLAIAPSVLAINIWVHLVGVYEGTKSNLYLDGIKIAEINANGTLNETGANLLFGKYRPSSPIFSNISIDDIRIYNRALSSSEVHSLYELEKPIPLQPLTDANFQDAINLWFSAEANATALYGHISDWNVSAVTDMSKAFKDRANFNKDISGWDVSNVTNMNSMFLGARSFNQPIGNWDVSRVSNMAWMLHQSRSFNQSIGSWDVSSVTNLSGMFNSADAFNKPIGDWNVSSVNNMWDVFNFAKSFNQPLDNWDVSSVTNMKNMFYYARNFNQPISSWDVSLVLNMESMFKTAHAFNQPLNDWNVSSVTNMFEMFEGASVFNQPLDQWDISSVNSSFNDIFNGANSLSDINKGQIHSSFSSNANWFYDWSEFVTYEAITDANFQDAINLWFSAEANATALYGHISDWNVSAVTDMSFAFKDKTTFNENLSAWDVSNVTNMSNMFHGATLFDKAIGDWNTSSVTRMNAMFKRAEAFNHPIGDWNTSAVSTMMQMFDLATSFNQDIGDWNTSSVTSLAWMFCRASSFNQNVSDWDTTNVTSWNETFKSSALSNAHKGLIHSSFSYNPNWPYDWSEFVTYEPITDTNFQDAINLWFNAEANATANYGHIRDWNVSAVTSMSQAFKGRSNFNEDISGWDVSSVNFFGQMFMEASSFDQNIGDWNVSQGKSFGLMFMDASAFNQDIGDWNVSSAINMGNMFTRASAFDQDISDWDVSSVTNMTWIFLSNSSLSSENKGKIHAAFSANPNWTIAWSNFVVSEQLTDANFQTAVNLWFDNQAEANATYGHIRDWNVSAVTSMRQAFMGRSNFNEDISGWDVSSVNFFGQMFMEASSFDQNIGDWNVSQGKSFGLMFMDASAFNQDIGDWNVSSAINMGNMFTRASAFDQDISDWDVSLVTNMTWIFHSNSSLSSENKGKIHAAFSANPNWTIAWSNFVVSEQLTDANFQTAVNLWFDNQAEANATYGHIRDWNVSLVTDMSNAFMNRSTFNEDISDWDTRNVSLMTAIFRGATAFNQDIGNWNMQSVTDLRMAFYGASAFNQDIGDWNLSSALYLRAMFNQAKSFNHDLDGWALSQDANMTGGMFFNADNLSEINMGKIHTTLSPNPTWPHDWSAFTADPNTSLLGDQNATMDGNHTGPGDGYGDPNNGLGDLDGNYSDADGEDVGQDGNDTGLEDGYGDPNDGFVKPNGNYFTTESNFESPDGNYSSAGAGYGKPDGNYSTPEGDYESPDGNYLSPGAGYGKPDDGFENSDGNYSSPEGDSESPDGNYLSPGAGIGKPDDGFENSGENYSTPEEDYESPDGNYLSPGAGIGKPDDGLGKPDGNYSTPQGDYEGTDGNYSSPGDGYEEPIEEIEPLFAPIVRTESVEEIGAGVYLFRGRVLTDGGDSIIEVGFEISKSLRFFEPIRLTAELEKGEFSLLFHDLEPGTSYYVRAYAQNSIGESPGSRKRFVTPSIPLPNFWWGEVEKLPGGWMNSSWFGTFKSYGYNWLYHGSMGWLYTSPVEKDGVWLWKDGMGWLWSRDGVWPYLWSDQNGSWIYLPPESGEPIFYDFSDHRYQRF